MPLFRRRARRSRPGRPERPGPHPRRRRQQAPRPPDPTSYDRIAPAYEEHDAPHTALVARDLVAALDPPPGARLLDVGTGTGVVPEAARQLLGDGARVIGVDLSVEMLRIGRQRGRLGPAAAGAAVDLPFGDAAFDALTASFVLSHVPRLDTVLFELRRVLAPGGKLGVTAWAPAADEFDRAWTEVAERYVGPDILRVARNRIVPNEERLGHPDRLKAVLYEGGFRGIHIDRRRYRFQWTREGYLDNRIKIRGARYMQHLLGDALWRRFQDDVRRLFAERFADRFGDFREVLVATGTRQD